MWVIGKDLTSADGRYNRVRERDKVRVTPRYRTMPERVLSS